MLKMPHAREPTPDIGPGRVRCRNLRASGRTAKATWWQALVREAASVASIASFRPGMVHPSPTPSARPMSVRPASWGCGPARSGAPAALG
jgi:hypothetical protein